MAETLSESLAKLAEKTKSLEDKVLRARKDSKKKLTKRIEESKAELQLKKDNFISHADQVHAKAESELNSFQTSLRQKVEHLKAEAQVKREHIHEKLEQQKHNRNIASAELHYNTSLDIAEYSIEWALIALAEVEACILEAYAAKLYVETLKESHK
jgi:exonuclease VII large subunit